eukprot:gene19446-26106_t
MAMPPYLAPVAPLPTPPLCPCHIATWPSYLLSPLPHACSPNLWRLSYLITSRRQLDEVSTALMAMPPYLAPVAPLTYSPPLPLPHCHMALLPTFPFAPRLPNLWRLSYLITSRRQLDEASTALMAMPKLTHLQLIVHNFTLSSEQLCLVGMLPLVNLQLDSFMYKQQPSLPRGSFSHIDNSGVKALVDSICRRAANNNRTTCGEFEQ